MNATTKNCDHKYECGCDRIYCEDCAIKNETDDLDFCDDESCKHYYSYRNDNCNCDGYDCGYCNPSYEDNYDEWRERMGVCDKCSNCDCELDEDTHIFCFEKKGENDMTMCSECGNDLADELREEGWKRDDDDDDMSECEECGERFECGTFNTIEEEDGTQFCFCDGCRDTLVENGSILATDEETIYKRNDNQEIDGVCFECGVEGKFIGKEGDDWCCVECSSI